MPGVYRPMFIFSFFVTIISLATVHTVTGVLTSRIGTPSAPVLTSVVLGHPAAYLGNLSPPSLPGYSAHCHCSTGCFLLHSGIQCSVLTGSFTALSSELYSAKYEAQSSASNTQCKSAIHTARTELTLFPHSGVSPLSLPSL